MWIQYVMGVVAVFGVVLLGLVALAAASAVFMDGFDEEDDEEDDAWSLRDTPHLRPARVRALRHVERREDTQ